VSPVTSSVSRSREQVCEADFFFSFLLPARLPPHPSILSSLPAGRRRVAQIAAGRR